VRKVVEICRLEKKYRKIRIKVSSLEMKELLLPMAAEIKKLEA
jgi:hypothetical protein